MYDAGPSALRERRIARLKELGIISKDVIPHEVMEECFPGQRYRQWEEMTLEERAKSARAMETYAGMVDCMDRCIGKVMQYLEDKGVADGRSTGSTQLIGPRYFCVFHVGQWVRGCRH